MAITVAQRGNPLKITGTTAGTDEIHKGREAIYISRIHWVAPTTAGHVLELSTSHGTVIAHLIAGADGVTEDLEIGAYFDDIYCTDMDSGTLYIYTR